MLLHFIIFLCERGEVIQKVLKKNFTFFNFAFSQTFDPEGRETARNTIASLVSGRLLRWSLGTTGFCDVTEKNDGVYPFDVIEINLTVNDRPHGERKRPSN